MTARAEAVQTLVQQAWIATERLYGLNPDEVATHRLAIVEIQEKLAQVLEQVG